MSTSCNPSSRRHLRRFGLTVATGFTLLGALSWFRGHTLAPLVFWMLAGLILGPALIAPALLGPIERAWLALGGWLAFVNTRVVLTAIFYLVVTPVGLALRLFHDPLDRRLHEARPSYWIRRNRGLFDAKSYERPF